MPREKHELRLAFWDELSNLIDAESNVLDSDFDKCTSEGPETDNWRSWTNLPANAVLGISLHYSDIIYVYLNLAHGETEGVFGFLEERRDEIEAAFDSQLQWRPKGPGTAVEGKNKILQTYDAELIESPEKWPEYQHWLLNTTERFYGVFFPYLRIYESGRLSVMA